MKFENVFIAREAKDDNLEQELSLADRRNKREIRLLEGEIPLWQVIVEKLNAASKILGFIILRKQHFNMIPRINRKKVEIHFNQYECIVRLVFHVVITKTL